MCNEDKLIAALEIARQVLLDALDELLDDEWDDLAHDVAIQISEIDIILGSDEDVLPESVQDAIDDHLDSSRLAIHKAEVN